jgi:hypothetical protein
MRWISDGAPLEPMIERSTRLTGEQLHALADRYDADRSQILRAPVTRDLAFGAAWGMLPPELETLCDAVTDAAHRAHLPASVALRAWGAVADAVTARLFPQLPAADIAELTQPWQEIVERGERAAA